MTKALDQYIKTQTANITRLLSMASDLQDMRAYVRNDTNAAGVDESSKSVYDVTMGLAGHLMTCRAFAEGIKEADSKEALNEIRTAMSDCGLHKDDAKPLLQFIVNKESSFDKESTLRSTTPMWTNHADDTISSTGNNTTPVHS